MTLTRYLNKIYWTPTFSQADRTRPVRRNLRRPGREGHHPAAGPHRRSENPAATGQGQRRQATDPDHRG